MSLRQIVPGSAFGIVLAGVLTLTAGTIQATAVPKQGGALTVDIPTGVINPCNGTEVVTEVVSLG